jgi:hypothetical protein
MNRTERKRRKRLNRQLRQSTNPHWQAQLQNPVATQRALDTLFVRLANGSTITFGPDYVDEMAPFTQSNWDYISEDL